MLMKKILSLVSFLSLSSCTLIPDSIKLPDFSESISQFSETIAPYIYKTDLKQGSVIRVDKFDLLKTGMTQEEVLKTIGSPSINDKFHKNQWEYIHHSFLKNDEILSLRITLYFEKEILSRIDLKNAEDLSRIEKNNINFENISPEDNQDEPPKDDWYKFW